MNYTIIYSDRKTVSLEIKAGGELLVRAPKGTKRKTIDEFVKQQSQWITVHRSKAPEKKPDFPPSPLYCKGKEYAFEVRAGEYAGFDGKTFYVTPGCDIKEALISVYKSIAKRDLTEKVALMAASTRLPLPSQVKITKANTRWGSCNGKTVNFSYHLIMQPEEYIDYVVLHELCHMKYLNHSKDFWELVERFMPDCGVRRKKLNEFGTILRGQGWY